MTITTTPTSTPAPTLTETATATDPSATSHSPRSYPLSHHGSPGTPTTGPMIGPIQTCARLGIDQPELLLRINAGTVQAYDLGGEIRFRRDQIIALALRQDPS